MAGDAPTRDDTRDGLHFERGGTRRQLIPLALESDDLGSVVASSRSGKPRPASKGLQATDCLVQLDDFFVVDR